MAFRSSLEEIRTLYDLVNYSLEEAIKVERDYLAKPKEGEPAPQLHPFQQRAFSWVRNQANHELADATKDWLLNRYSSTLSDHAQRLHELIGGLKDGSILTEFRLMRELQDKTFERLSAYNSLFSKSEPDNDNEE